jgi:hypothetical protein
VDSDDLWYIDFSDKPVFMYEIQTNEIHTQDSIFDILDNPIQTNFTNVVKVGEFVDDYDEHGSIFTVLF